MNWNRIVGSLVLGAVCAVVVWVSIAIVIVIDRIVPGWILIGLYLLFVITAYVVDVRFGSDAE